MAYGGNPKAVITAVYDDVNTNRRLSKQCKLDIQPRMLSKTTQSWLPPPR